MNPGLRFGLLLVGSDADTTISTAVRLGYDGVELALSGHPSEGDSRSIDNWVARCSDNGLHLAAHAPSIDVRLDSVNPGIRRESVRQIRACIDALGNHLEYLTFHTGYIRRFAKVGSLERAIESVAELAAAAGRQELHL